MPITLFSYDIKYPWGGQVARRGPKIPEENQCFESIFDIKVKILLKSWIWKIFHFALTLERANYIFVGYAILDWVLFFSQQFEDIFHSLLACITAFETMVMLLKIICFGFFGFVYCVLSICLGIDTFLSILH